MRHAYKKHKIGRSTPHRLATLRSMSAALIEHKRIRTTLGKARALRPFVEPILHRAHDDSTHSRRMAFRALNDKEAVKALYAEIAPAIEGRPGGYVRIVKLGQRDGDAADMAIVELVDFNDVKPDGAAGTKRKTRRSRRRRGGSDADSGGSGQAQPQGRQKPTTPAEAIEAVSPVPTGVDGGGSDAAETTPAPVAESAEDEAAVSDNATPDGSPNPQVAQTPDANEHGDAPQGAAPGTGEPPPEAQAENRGRSEHRG